MKLINKINKLSFLYHNKKTVTCNKEETKNVNTYIKKCGIYVVIGTLDTCH